MAETYWKRGVLYYEATGERVKRGSADEVQARIDAAVAEAVERERERCAAVATKFARDNAGARLVAGVRGVSTNLSKLARAKIAIAIRRAIRQPTDGGSHDE